jgi:hypothetical protein
MVKLRRMRNVARSTLGKARNASKGIIGKIWA